MTRPRRKDISRIEIYSCGYESAPRSYRKLGTWIKFIDEAQEWVGSGHWVVLGNGYADYEVC